MLSVVDFFCGCGGTSAGLRAAGMNIIAGIDVDKESKETFESNFPEAKYMLSDIRRLRTDSLQELIPKDGPLLFSGCAPCQPFSKQRSPILTTKDSRVNLLNSFGRFVREYEPSLIFVENVPSLEDSSVFQRFVRDLEKMDYSCKYRVIRAQDYGVPQRRTRLILIASLLGEIEFPEPTHGPLTEQPYSTVWEWIGDLPKIEQGEEHPFVPNHRAASLSKLNLQRIKATPEGGSRLDWPKRLVLDCHKTDHSGHTDVYGRMWKDLPAAALTTRCISLSNGRFGHPIQDRAISVREAACLQTFPRDFRFYGSLNSMARQIGNAVPVLLAKTFGIHLLNHLRSLKTTEVA